MIALVVIVGGMLGAAWETEVWRGLVGAALVIDGVSLVMGRGR